MELKKVIEKILPVYEKALVDMPNEGYYEWLCEKNMNCGICWYAHEVLDVDIYTEMAKNLSNSKSTYIGKLPWCDCTYTENLKRIKSRVDWMRDYLQEN